MSVTLLGTARRRNAIVIGAIFLGGWAGGALMNRRPAHAAESTSAAPPTAESAAGSSCVDRAAMEANANLVNQLHDIKGRLTIAQEHKREAEAKAAGLENGPHSRLLTSREEWGRMAREGTVRIRVPCTSWDSGSGFSIRKATPQVRMGSTSRNYEMNRRADAAGLSSAELETLADAYTRSRAHMWAAMRSTCEANSAYRDALEEIAKMAAEDKERSASPTPLDDDARIAICQANVIDLTEETTRTAATRVAELRAAGAGIDKAANDEQRVMFALTTGGPDLFDEMTRLLGKEKAIRALDNGVVCLDETVYDVRATPEVHAPQVVRTIESDPHDDPPSEPEG